MSHSDRGAPSEKSSKGNKITDSELRESRKTDRRAVYVGAVVTTVATFVLFASPELLVQKVDAFKLWYYDLTGTWISSDNPFTSLRIFGGCVGGAVAGWMTSDFGSGITTGVKAALYGLGIAYVTASTGFFLYWSLVVGMFPPPVMSVMMMTSLYVIMLFGPHLVGGAIAGGVTDRLKHRQ